MITKRLLPAAEWSRLTAFPPFCEGGLPDPDHWRIVVAEDDGLIVGFCCLFDTVHWDCWYVQPEYRGNPVVFKDLVEGGVQVMIDYQIDLVHTTVPDGSGVGGMLERFGFEPAPGSLYYYTREG